jgi:hypothetical protein
MEKNKYGDPAMKITPPPPPLYNRWGDPVMVISPPPPPKGR